MEKITVRFVPRGRGRLSFSEAVSAAPGAVSAQMKPTKSNMQKGHSNLSDRGVRSVETAQHRLVTQFSRDEFDKMFDSPALTQKPTQSKETGIPQRESYYQVTELKVPDALQDSIAFAYVPRPVEYHAPLAIPPKEHIFHLTLSDIELALNARRCHQQNVTGAKIRVAMVDSGFWPHPYFVRSGFKLLPTESTDSGPASIDASGHGTGEAANIFAVAPDCTVLGIKQGSSSASDLETAIELNPHIMTNSWGFDIDGMSRRELERSDRNMFLELLDLEQIITEALEKNIVVLFSAGNGHLAFPASFPGVISVGGVTVTEDGALEASSYASAFESELYPGRTVPDVCGIVGRSDPTGPLTGHIMLPVPPGARLDGENFPSGQTGLGWGIFSGTSAACPQVAGVVALLKQLNNNLTPSQIRQVLETRAVDVTTGTTATGEHAQAGKDLATGAGLVDALRACGFIEGMV